MLLNIASIFLMRPAGEGDEGGDGGGGEPAAAPAPVETPTTSAEPAPEAAAAPEAPLKPVAARAAAKKAAGAPSAPSGTSTPGATKPAVVLPPAAGGVPAAPVFTPKMTYRAKGQEKKFPDWMTPAQIKDAAQEAQIREVFEKADGLDPVKAERDQVKQLIQERYEPMAQAVETASHFLKKGDLTSFFEVADIREEDVIKWAIKRSNMDANAKAADAVARSRDYQAFTSGNQTSVQQQDMQLQLVASRERELSLVLSQPERTAFVQTFDARFGQPGRFVSEVIKRGQLYAAQGQDVSVEQAVTEVMQLAGYVPGQAAALALVPAAGQAAIPPAAGQAAAPATPAAPGQARQRPPVIPNMQGSGGSPVKRVVKNRADLLQKRDELRAQGR